MSLIVLEPSSNALVIYYGQAINTLEKLITEVLERMDLKYKATVMLIPVDKTESRYYRFSSLITQSEVR